MELYIIEQITQLAEYHICAYPCSLGLTDWLTCLMWSIIISQNLPEMEAEVFQVMIFLLIKGRALRYKKGVHFFSVNPEYVECRGNIHSKVALLSLYSKNNNKWQSLHTIISKCWCLGIRRMSYWWIMIDSKGHNVGSMLGCFRSWELRKAHSVVHFLLTLAAIWDRYWFFFFWFGKMRLRWKLIFSTSVRFF